MRTHRWHHLAGWRRHGRLAFLRLVLPPACTEIVPDGVKRALMLPVLAAWFFIGGTGLYMVALRDFVEELVAQNHMG